MNPVVGPVMTPVMGLGLRATADFAAFEELALRLGAPLGCPVALPAFRAGLPLVAALRASGRQVILIPRQDLLGLRTPSQSPRSLAQYGTGSVAEACALLSARGTGLIAHSLTSANRSMTAALARGWDKAEDIPPTERPLP